MSSIRMMIADGDDDECCVTACKYDDFSGELDSGEFQKSGKSERAVYTTEAMRSNPF